MAISQKKKRYVITMTPAVFNRFQSLRAEFGMPVNTLSNVCEDALNHTADLLQMAKEQGKLDLSDLFKLMGKQMELSGINSEIKAPIDYHNGKLTERKGKNVHEPKRNKIPDKR